MIYPNPAQDYIILDLANFAEDQVEFDLVSVVGDIVKKDLIAAETKTRIDVSDLAPGLYIVKVRTNSAIQAVRFIKE